mmetsp:Transcript_45339/g.144093  ORF Transcript_45339/g.144093 Transcript_45339/m.144093 type:complete len:322 (-) Transcript_45339:728-1693(-)
MVRPVAHSAYASTRSAQSSSARLLCCFRSNSAWRFGKLFGPERRPSRASDFSSASGMPVSSAAPADRAGVTDGRRRRLTTRARAPPPLVSPTLATPLTAHRPARAAARARVREHLISSSSCRALLLARAPVGDQPPLRSARVPLEPLEPRQRHRVLHLPLRRHKVVDPHPGALPQKGVDGEAARVLSGARRRQHVVGAGAVVAEHLRRAGADEEAAIVLQPAGERHRLLDVQLDVLDGQPIVDGDRLVQARHHDRVAVLQRLRRHLASGEHRQLRRQLAVDRRGELLRQADEGGQRRRVVLRLREEVGCHHRGRGAAVCDD